MKYFKYSVLGLSFFAAIYVSNTSAEQFMTNGNANELWQVKSSKTSCTLSQQVTYWGDVEFSVLAGKDKVLEVLLSPVKEFSNPHALYIREESPQWKPGVKDEDIGMIAIFRQFPGYYKGEYAWHTLNILEKGKSPAFVYKDSMYYKNNQEIKVNLNPKGVKEPLKEFHGCIANLLNYSYDDIKNSVLHFKEKSFELTAYSIKRLEQITEFFDEEKNDVTITIYVHTDSIGPEADNKELTDKQANVIKRYFMDKGFMPKYIFVESYGESHIAVSDKTEDRRRINRRVSIEIGNITSSTLVE